AVVEAVRDEVEELPPVPVVVGLVDRDRLVLVAADLEGHEHHQQQEGGARGPARQEPGETRAHGRRRAHAPLSSQSADPGSVTSRSASGLTRNRRCPWATWSTGSKLSRSQRNCST